MLNPVANDITVRRAISRLTHRPLQKVAQFAGLLAENFGSQILMQKRLGLSGDPRDCPGVQRPGYKQARNPPIHLRRQCVSINIIGRVLDEKGVVPTEEAQIALSDMPYRFVDWIADEKERRKAV